MADHNPGDVALLALVSSAKLGHLLVAKGIITDLEFVTTVRDTLTAFSSNPRHAEMRAVLKDVFPAAGF